MMVPWVLVTAGAAAGQALLQSSLTLHVIYIRPREIHVWQEKKKRKKNHFHKLPPPKSCYYRG